MKKVLVIGADSDIATQYISSLVDADVWQTSKTGYPGYQLNLTELEHISPELLNQCFDVAIVFAAMTKITECEAKPSLAQTINCDALIHLQKSLSVEHWIVLSTNSVFSGEINVTPADSKHAPFNQYGITKAKMERYFLTLGSMASIVRLTKVITPKFTFFQDNISKVQAGEHVNVFNDMLISPLTLSQVADYLVKLSNSPVAGIHQLSGLHDVSYYEALKYLVKKMELRSDLVVPVGKTVLSPKYTCLLVTKNALDLGFKPKHYKTALSEFLAGGSTCNA